MGRKKPFGEEDKVLRFAVIAALFLFAVSGMAVAVRMTNLRVDASEGEEKLKELEKKNVQEIDKKIQKLEKKEQKAIEKRLNRTDNEKFADCVIVGDSICMGLYEYEYLDAAFVSAQAGLGVCSPDASGLTDVLSLVIAGAPKRVFFALGMCDVAAAGADADVFVQAYKEALSRIKKELPDAGICVNSVLPVSQEVINGDSSYACIPEYNEKLQRLCEEENVLFIDNTGILKGEYYEEDGVHMKPDYYPEWIHHMAEEADL